MNHDLQKASKPSLTAVLSPKLPITHLRYHMCILLLLIRIMVVGSPICKPCLIGLNTSRRDLWLQWNTDLEFYSKNPLECLHPYYAYEWRTLLTTGTIIFPRLVRLFYAIINEDKGNRSLSFTSSKKGNSQLSVTLMSLAPLISLTMISLPPSPMKQGISPPPLNTILFFHQGFS